MLPTALRLLQTWFPEQDRLRVLCGTIKHDEAAISRSVRRNTVWQRISFSYHVAPAKSFTLVFLRPQMGQCDSRLQV